MRGVVAMLGLVFVVVVVYIDLGNFVINIVGGVKYGYMLLWVIVVVNLMVMFVQYLLAKIGIVMGKNLLELCCEHFKKLVIVGFWL